MTHPLLEGLASDDPAARRAACRAAAEDPSAVLLVDALSDALGDPDRGVARAASDALATLGRSGVPIGAALRSALRSSDPRRRWGGAFTSARIEPPDLRLVPATVEALGFEESDARWAAARVLVDTGRLHGQVLPLLVGLVRSDPSPGVRRMASHCLRELAPDRPETADALLAATRDADLGVRRAALTGLAALLEPPAAVRARLGRVLAEDPDAASRQLAAAALARLESSA